MAGGGMGGRTRKSCLALFPFCSLQKKTFSGVRTIVTQKKQIKNSDRELLF